MAVAILLAGAAGKNKVTALRGIIVPSANKFFVNYLASRHNQKRIAIEIFVLGNDIDWAAKTFERAIRFQNMAHRIPADG